METGSSMPSRTKRGATRSSTLSLVSATKRLRAGVFRNRRNLLLGKDTATVYKWVRALRRGEVTELSGN